MPLCALLLASSTYACPADRIDARGLVAEVYDGDTMRLIDGRWIRLIGLDTPELGRDGETSQPFARRAADAVRDLLARHDDRVLMRYDVEKRDHYGRALAHLYLPNKTSITAYLLRAGLATHLVVPPDLYNLDCYRQAEHEARTAKAGIWSLPRYRVIASSELDPDARGFRLIEGTLERVGYSSDSIWLNLQGDVALRIDREDLANFPHDEFSSLEGKQVIARGWLYAHEGELRMQIRHPASLELKH